MDQLIIQIKKALETHKDRVRAEKATRELEFGAISKEKAEESAQSSQRQQQPPQPLLQDSPKGYLDNPKRRRSIRDLTAIPGEYTL